MNRVTIRRDMNHQWRVNCPTCPPVKAMPGKTNVVVASLFSIAIAHANYHARTCPQRTTP